MASSCSGDRVHRSSGAKVQRARVQGARVQGARVQGVQCSAQAYRLTWETSGVIEKSGWPGVGILWLSEKASFICSF